MDSRMTSPSDAPRTVANRSGAADHSEWAAGSIDERLRDIINHAPFGAHTYELTADGRLVLSGFNPAAERMLGLAHTGLVGQTIEEAFPVAAGTELPDAYRRVATSGEPLETVFTVRDGETITGSFELHGLRTGPNRVTVFFRDVTERARADESARESRERMELALWAADLGSWDWNVQTGDVQYNERWATMLGYRVEELASRAETWESLVHPDDRRDVFAILNAHLDGRTPSYEVEHRLRHKSGSWVWVLSRGRVTARDAQGRPLRAAGTHLDISKRRQAEEHLQQERVFTNAVLDSVPGLLYLYDAEGHLVRWNRQHELMTGYSADEVGRMKLLDWFEHSPEDVPQITGGVQKALLEGYAEAEGNLQTKDGRKILFRFNAVRLEIQGKPYIAGIGIDITERRRAEESLRQSEARLETAQALALIGSWEIDPVTGAGYWSKQVFRLFGLEPAAGATTFSAFGDLVHPDDRERLEQARLQVCASGQPCAVDYRTNPARGDVRHLSAIINAICDRSGNVTRLYGTLQDITARVRTEEALRRTEHMLVQIFRSSPTFIVVSTEDEGRFVEANEAFTEMLGFERREVVGRLSSELNLWPSPKDRARIVRTVDEQGATRNVETRVRRKDGTILDITVSVARITIDDQPCLIWLGSDISSRRRAEQEQARLQDQLQQAMKMEAVGRLAGGVAHDFNNLLTVIRGNVEMAAEILNPSDPLHQCLDGIKRAADSSASLTRQLLAFSRRQIIEPRILNLSALVGELQKMLGRLIGEDIALQTRLADDLGSVRVDPGQFEQVLVNLAVNARDAMPNGGQLVIETVNVDLDDAYCAEHPDTKPGEFVMLAVSDTGHGMTDEVRQRLFEPFFTTKPKGRGTGLGLAMIFGAVKQSGGSIEVTSEPDHGTTFTIYLPRIAAPAEKLARPAPAADLPRGTEAVLLVEDEASVRELATSMLKRLGYRVHVASNGGEAFMLAEKLAEPIHLLMTDVVMPGMNGRELAQRLLILHPEMSVLFTSGYTDDVIVHHGVLDEHLNFIGKPYSLQGLAAKVRQVLDAQDRQS